MINVYANKYSLKEMAEACGIPIEAFHNATPERLALLAQAIGEKKLSDHNLKKQIILATAGS